ncbi:MAG: hypothetical protein SOY42_12310 [Clostridium sp.]|nr:hypothetical protein [Clostridium sp.]
MIDITKLDDESIKMALQLITVELSKFIIKNNKRFLDITRGSNLNSKSNLLQKRMPEEILKEIKKGDKTLISFINQELNQKMNCINKTVEQELESDKELLKIINNYKPNKNNKRSFISNIGLILEKNDRRYFIRFINVLLEKVQSKCISVYFTLNEINLSTQEKKLIENIVENKEILKAIKEETKKQEKEKSKKELENIKKNYNEENRKLKDENRKLKNEIYEIKKESKNNETIINKNINEKEIINKNLNEQLIETNLKNNNLELKVKNIKDNYELKLKEELNLRKEAENKILKLKNDLAIKYEDYSKKYELSLIEKNRKIIDEENNLKENIKNLNIFTKELEDKIKKLTLEEQEKKKKLDEYNSSIKNFIDNIDKEIIINALRNSMLNINGIKNPKEENMQLYIKNSKITSKVQIEISEDIDDFSYYLSENLKNIGAVKNRNEISDYIVSSLAAKMIPLLVGYKTREIAKAISFSYFGEMPLIITVPSGYNNINELIEVINNCKSKVILIEGLIGQMNEFVMLTLFKEYNELQESDKILLISCEDSNMVHAIPEYLLKYIVLIELVNIKPIVKHEYIYSNSIDVFNSFKNEELDHVDSIYKKLKKIFTDLNYDNSYIISRTLILSYLCKIQDELRILENFVICDLRSSFRDYELKEKFIENIQNNIKEFDSKLIDIIKGD